EDSFDLEEGENRKDIGRHICIELAGKEFAIPLSSVLEAGENLSVQSLPLLPDWITGITNIRGEIISVVNLSLFFDIKDSEQITKHKLIDINKSYLIIHNDTIKIAILVDKILATRPLYSLVNKKFKNAQKKDMLSKHFSGQAFYERDNVQKGIFLFDLDKFLYSGKLHDFSSA
ncbi:MAG: chemotaxis protein CheW, partial [Desulfobacteraceae bacterium]|nr:chemotaxis protein CheW [Desulfobacteraceae bacterium]